MDEEEEEVSSHLSPAKSWWSPGTTPFPCLDLHFLIFRNEKVEVVQLLGSL
jgi:hypothetical protein